MEYLETPETQKINCHTMTRIKSVMCDGLFFYGSHFWSTETMF